MTPLRHRMIEDLQLKGYSDSTQSLYVHVVRRLCEHFSKTPGKITEDDLRGYFLYGKNVKKWSRSTSTVALCGIKFFYENTLKRPWPTLLFIRPGREKKLPVIVPAGGLSPDHSKWLPANTGFFAPVEALSLIFGAKFRRIEKLENDQVTFRFKNSDTDQWETARLPAFDFIHRFLQHVLPKGFVKIR